MRIRLRKVKRIAMAITALGVLALMIVGCSGFDSPTAPAASTQEYSGLWNPQPGDMINGHEVPLVGEDYWENAYGPEINPFMVPPRTFRIGPEGGMIMFGQHSLWIPPGAVNDVIMITVSNGSATGVAIDCTPSPYHFNVPVTFNMSYRGTQYDGDGGGEGDGDVGDPPLRVMYMSPDGSLEELPGRVDAYNQIVTGESDHFSRYIIG